MRKLFTILALLVCAALLMGCTTRDAAPEAAAAPEITAAPAAADPTATPIPPSAAPDPTAEPETAAPQDEAIYRLLEGIFDNYHAGTAGSSLSAAYYAASLVSTGTEIGPDAVRASAASWDRGMVTEYDEPFVEKLDVMYSTAYALYGSYVNVLNDCGYTGEWNYTTRQIREVFTAVYDGLGIPVPNMVRVYAPNYTADGFRAYAVDVADADSLGSYAEMFTQAMSADVLDGTWFFTVEPQGDTVLVDMNEGFGQMVRAQGTAGEMMYIGSVVNTVLDYFDAETVTLTVAGHVLQTGHNVYDEPLTFFGGDGQ